MTDDSSLRRSSTGNQKQWLRCLMVRSILSLAPEDRYDQEMALRRRFEDLLEGLPGTAVLLFASHFPEEYDTAEMVLRALDAGKEVVCPRVVGRARGLSLHQIRGRDDLVAGKWGIPEPRAACRQRSPEEIDWALVPGVAFGERGDRLGRGGGYYDRLLPQLRTDAQTWSLAFDCQVLESLPTEPHDVPVYGIATPQRLLLPGIAGPARRESSPDRSV